MEVIEHVDPPRLGALERSVFGSRGPATVIVTTPNVEYNVRYETLPAGRRGTATTASNGPGRSSGTGPAGGPA